MYVYTYAALFVMLASSWMLVVLVPAPLWNHLSKLPGQKQTGEPALRRSGWVHKKEQKWWGSTGNEWIKILESGFREPLPWLPDL